MADTVKITKENIHEDRIILGLALLVLFLIGLTLQTATTELNGQPIADTTVWSLFINTISQLPGLFTGSIHMSELPRVLIGWGVEIVYYVCVTAHGRMKQAVANHHPWAIIGLDVVAGACVAFCGYTDWAYAAQIIPNFFGQVFFAVFISALVAYCGPAGISFIKSGFGR
jgi:hypothetical protein